ncbi:MAG TPA: PilZ domain-containing protein [Tepidisphaeraceae bacterium]|nr:PilZ domain-containing protein [Tepidisphaeraceae bacterium]
MHAAGMEKRRASRIELQAKVHISIFADGKIVRSLSAITRDISFTGIGIMSAIPLECGDTFIIQLPRQSKTPIYVVSRVMFSRPIADSLFTIGGEFTRELPNSEAEALFKVDQDQQKRIRDAMLV